jgi:3-hydroxyacyl-CoA dehydrogenase
MQTIYNVDKLWGAKLEDPHLLDRAEWIKHNFIDKGKLGINSGEGFYTYPHPKWQEPGFLK